MLVLLLGKKPLVILAPLQSRDASSALDSVGIVSQQKITLSLLTHGGFT